jgi:hypothetical protein
MDRSSVDITTLTPHWCHPVGCGNNALTFVITRVSGWLVVASWLVIGKWLVVRLGRIIFYLGGLDVRVVVGYW